MPAQPPRDYRPGAGFDPRVQYPGDVSGIALDPQTLGAAGYGTLPNLMSQGPPAPGTSLGGLDLGSVASSAMAETDTRIAGQSDMLQAYLNQILGEQAAMGQAATERDLRMQEFERQQQMLAEQMASRQASAQTGASGARQAWEAEQAGLQRGFLADEANRQRAFELGQGAGGMSEKDKMRFSTDENIRQAMALSGLQSQEGVPRESDFGASVVNPYRGQALLPKMEAWTSKPENQKQWQDVMDFASKKVNENKDSLTIVNELRKKFKGLEEVTSYALWQLGVGLGG